MIELLKTDQFDSWFRRLRDRNVRARIQARLDRLQYGHFGDVRVLEAGVKELRIFYGPGYRVYFTRRSGSIVLLLLGGTKSSQSEDIRKAVLLARDLEK